MPFTQVRWSVVDGESGLQDIRLGLIDGPVAAPTRWLDMASVSQVRLSARDLLVDSVTYFVIEACNHARLCSRSNISRGVRLLSAEPSGGLVQIHNSANASDGFINSPHSITGAWRNFTASVTALSSSRVCIVCVTLGMYIWSGMVCMLSIIWRWVPPGATSPLL